MNAQLTLFLVFAILSVVLVVVASLIPDDRYRVNGRLAFDPDADETRSGSRYEGRLLAQYCACIAAFLAGCCYGMQWAVGGVVIVILLIVFLSCLEKYSKQRV